MKTRRTLLLICFFALISTAETRAENFSFSNLTMSSGLSNNSVYCIKQDYRGFMWLGTFSGLNRYDGNKFIVYKPELKTGSISSSVIFTIYEDSKKRLWVGTDGGGLNLYDREKDAFISFRHDSGSPFSISSDQVYAILEDTKGNLWIGTDGGGLNIMREDGSFIPFDTGRDDRNPLENSIIRVLYQDSKGRILIGTEGKGLSVVRYGIEGFFTYTKSQGNPLSLQSDIIRTIFEDSSGRIWIGMENAGISEFIPEKNEFIPLVLPGTDANSGISVRAVTEDNEGKLWIGTDNDGIYIYSPETGKWDIIRSGSSQGSLSNETIRSLLKDSNGHMWIGTRDGGVNLYNPLSSRFRSIDAEGITNPRKNQIREIIETPDGRIWIATDGGGLRCYDMKTGALASFSRDTPGKQPSSAGHCYSLCYDGKSRIWTGTDGEGITLFNIKTEKWENSFRKGDGSGLSSDVVWDIYIDRQGELWAGTEGGGLNHFNRESRKFTSFQFDPKDSKSLNGNSVRDIFEDSSGRLWIGTWDGGLNLMDRENRTFRCFQFSPASPDSLSDNTVNCIFEDSRKQVWIGTAGGGLNLYTGGENFRAYRETDGLAGDNVMGIGEDKSGNIWITTDNGLSVFNSADESIFSYGEEDGLQDNEFTRKAFCVTTGGIIFAGNTGGINYFNPEEIKQYYHDPPILLTSFRILNREVPSASVFPGGTEGRRATSSGRIILDRTITETEKIRITQDDRVITFDFSILDFIATHRNRYFAYLEGFDSEWSSLGSSGSVTYTSLPHGSYTLKVRGENHTGQKLSRMVSLEIRILPYFWQTWYFKAALSLFSCAAVYLTIRAKTRQLRRKNEQLSRFSEHIQNAREEERKNAAREVHDELGQILSALKIDIYRFGKNSPPSFRQQTDSMLDLVNRALDSIKSLSANLRPRVLDTLSLEEALQWQTVEFQRRTKIKCDFIKENLEDDFDKDVSTAVFRVYQEILTNILRHSGADTVSVNIKSENGKIILLVTDNGCGITQEKIDDPDSFGLLGMKERCRNFGGKLKISPGEERGTVIEAVIPCCKKGKGKNEYTDS